MVKIFGFLILLLGFLPVHVEAETVFSRHILTGSAIVTDGDTIKIGGERIRLFGIDAPESNQSCRTEHGVTWRCGAWVTRTLKSMLEGKQVTCIWDARDGYKRPIAQCQLGGQDLSALMVRNGLALAYRKYSTDYVVDEAMAARADLGLWSGSIQTPAAFRQIAQKAEKPPSTSCAIKGNISKSGRIYHLPGSKWYNRTKIDSRRGERWFCSIKEAQKAGWRAPRR